MKHADLQPGMKVGYRWPAFVTHAGGPFAEAEIIDPAWVVPLDRCHEGVRVRCSDGAGARLILYRLPGQRPELRADLHAERFEKRGRAERQRRGEHFEREGIRLAPGGPPTVVALMAEGSGTAWEPATAAITVRGKLLVRTEDGRDVDDVDPRRLRGPGFLQSEDDRRRYTAAKKAERDRRTALKAETAARLGLGDDAVSLSDPTWDGAGYLHRSERADEVVLVLTPGALAGLIDRALSDPEWAAQLQGEGVLDALAALGGF